MKPTRTVKKALILALSVLGLIGLGSAILSPGHFAVPIFLSADRSAVPSRYSLEARFDKAKYFLGENVLLDFTVQNTGTTPFSIDIGGDYRGTCRQTRFKLTATAEDGSKAKDPHPFAEMFCMGGMGGGSKLAPSDSFTETLALADYVRISKPGKYKISVSHDLGWNVIGNLPSATGQVEFLMPSPEQASGIVERMYRLPRDHSYNLAGGKEEDYADFTTLSYPVYLAPLLAKVNTGSPEQAELALTGIASIHTPEATAALIEIAGRFGKNKTLSLQSAKLLAGRLPQTAECSSGRCPLLGFAAEENKEMVAESWRDSFAPQVRELTETYLSSADPDLQAAGAPLSIVAGNGKDLKSLMQALNAALLKSRTLPVEKGLAHRPRGEAPALLEAAAALAGRENLPENPHNAGESAVFMSVIKKDQNFRPSGWQMQYKNCFASDIPYVRQLALETCPSPVPAEFVPSIAALIRDSDIDVQSAAVRLVADLRSSAVKDSLAATLSDARVNDHLLVAQLCDALDRFDRSETLLILASRLGDYGAEAGGSESGWFDIELINRAVEASGGGSRVGVPGPPLSQKRLAESKVRQPWLNLIKTNREFFRAGGRLKPGDARLTPELFPPYLCVTTADGKEWPPMSAAIQQELINEMPEYYSTVGRPSPIKTPGQVAPEVNLSSRSVQEELLKRMKAALPANWKIRSTHTGLAPEGWISKDRRTVFCIEAAGPDGAGKVWVVPADWVGILQSPDHHHSAWDWTCWDRVLCDGTYKILGQGEMPFINVTFYKILPGAHTACLADKPGFDMDMQVFTGKLQAAETQAKELITENCKTEESLAEGIDSLVELGVPARKVILQSARLLRGINGGRGAFEAVENFSGKDSKEVLLKILCDPLSDEEVLTKCALSLDKLDDVSDPRCAPALTEALRRVKSDQCRASISKALAHTGDPSAGKTVLTAFIKMKDIYSSVDVAEILVNLHCRDAIQPIEQLDSAIKSSRLPKYTVDSLSRRVVAAVQRLKG